MAENVSLREYFEARLDAMDMAVKKAEAAADKRLEGLNEMRGMVTDAASRYMPRAEFDTAYEALEKDVDWLKSIVMPRSEFDIKYTLLETKISQVQKFIWIGTGIVTTVQFVIGILVLVWRHE